MVGARGLNDHRLVALWSSDSVDDLESRVEEALAAAEEARSTAENTQSTAEEALSKAEDACFELSQNTDSFGC